MGKKLRVRNLAAHVDSSTLEDLITTVGDVESIRVCADPMREGRQVGYVQMATEQGALDCIDRFHGQENDGLILIVTEDIPHVPQPYVTKKKRATPKKSAARSQARS
jgi:hypothetical protein